MNISQKGIILVLVPLLLQLAVVGFLLGQLLVFNEARIKEFQAKRAVTLSLELGFLSAGTYGALYVYALTGHKELLSSYYNSLEQQRERLSELIPLVNSRFGSVKSFEQFQLRLEKQQPMEKEFIAEIAAGPQNKIPTLLKFATPYFVNMMRSMDDVDRMSRTFNADATRQAEAVSRLWERQKIIVWGGIVASAILTVVMARFFAVGVTRRLSVVEANTNLLVQKKTLNSPIGGSDEIGNLDTFFHDMADRLAAASQFKRDFYAMVSHDLRNPLSSVRGLVELVGAGAFGEIDESARTKLYQGSKELDHLLVLINDILDLEKLESGSMPLNLEPVEFPQLLEQLKDSYSDCLSSCDVELVVEAPSLSFLADRERLFRALASLLSVALDLAASHKRVVIKGSTSGENVRIEFFVDTGGSASLPVPCLLSDEANDGSTGSGSPSKGIALNLARLVVDLHGGSMGEEAGGSGNPHRLWIEIAQRRES